MTIVKSNLLCYELKIKKKMNRELSSSLNVTKKKKHLK